MLRFCEVQVTQDWIKNYLQNHCGMDQGVFRSDLTFGDVGLTSVDLLQLIEALVEASGCDLEETLPFEFPTVLGLATVLKRLHG